MPRKLKGIRRRRGSWEVYVNVNRHRYSTTFPIATPVQEMRAWRDEQIATGIPPISSEDARRRDIEQRLRRYRRSWWIYFIQGDAHVKIGRTSNVPARVKALQTASPIPLRLLARVREGGTTEAALHRRFAHLHAAGEWFRLGPDLQEFIASCAAS